MNRQQKTRSVNISTAKFVVVLALGAFLFPTAHAEASQNIVFIMLDDLGYGDISTYNPETLIKTPVIDAEIAGPDSVHFTQYYSDPVCSPTRAEILTGRYPQEFGIRRPISYDSKRGLPNVTTLADMLQEEGYTTAHIGKWHLGVHDDAFAPIHFGFDETWEYDWNEHDTDGYYNTLKILHREWSGTQVQQETLSNYVDYDFETGTGDHKTKVLTDLAIDFIEKNNAEPFFLNVWYHAPHTPLEPMKGWWNDGAGEDDYNVGDFTTAEYNYANLVTTVDDQIGRILETIDTLGIYNDTIIIIASDNGGTANAHTSGNNGFRGYKKEVWEGGIRVPFIVRFPGHIGRQINNSFIRAFDIFPTLADIVDADVSALPLEGQSFKDAIEAGDSILRDDILFWEIKYDKKETNPAFGDLRNTFAVRHKLWKLVFEDIETNIGQPFLYHIKNDPGESTDLSTDPDQTARVDTLMDAYDAWRERVGEFDYDIVGTESSVEIEGELFTFSGAGGRVELAEDPRFNFNEADFSFTTRVKLDPNALGTVQVLMNKDGSLNLRTTGNNIILFALTDENGDKVKLRSTTTLEADKWYDITVTVFGYQNDESVVRLYIDGMLEEEKQGTDSLESVAVSDSPVYLGNNIHNDNPFIGQMENPRFFSLSMTQEEVLSW